MHVLQSISKAIQEIDPSTENVVFIGYTATDGEVIIVGIAAIEDHISSKETLRQILPKPLKVLEGISVEQVAELPTLSANPLEEKCRRVVCSLQLVIEEPDGLTASSGIAYLEKIQKALQASEPEFLIVPSRKDESPILANGEFIGDVQKEVKILKMEAVVRSSHIDGKENRSSTNFLQAPIVNVKKSSDNICWTTLQLGALAYVPHATPLDKAAREFLQPELIKQVEIAKQELRKRKQLVELCAYHFHIPGLDHIVTLLYPQENNEDTLREQRLLLHRLLRLPTDRPLVRYANALKLDDNALNLPPSAGGRLMNVHNGLPPSGIRGGTIHIVQGDYDYYHYMQDKFDDKGWGCAYRSLQTICSWFLKQHYTGKTPPSHREIQTILVDLGDKSADFIGSRQWIGAIELGYILDSFLGIQSKILTVSSGSDMPSKAREIAAHFDTQGTPIMIGGGVLAYTLLGIDYNEATGECAFLILDPHYTGSEDLNKIHSGQWVSWKRLGDKAAAGGDLFVASSFYNLLCPTRPIAV